MNVLILRNLSIGYKSKRNTMVVQQSINAELHNGEIVCLLGENGCGKSTLLRTLGGLQKSLGGEILVAGKDLHRLSNTERARQMSLVLTERITGGEMRVRELVAMGRYPHTGWLGDLLENDRRIIAESIRLVRLEHKSEAFFDELSDGEKQRAIIAKALAQDTPIILLDEPTAHLDLPNRVEVMLLLRKLARETGKAILLSTHELDLALQAADKIWFMHKERMDIMEKGELKIENGELKKGDEVIISFKFH